MADRSAARTTIYAAIIGSILVALAKVVAAVLTGSAALFSESFHSIADGGNEILLLYGERRADRSPDTERPFGYGREIFFWSFVVAILLFALGAGLSTYEGIDRILHPAPITDPAVSYVVLAVSAVFEAGSWIIAWRNFPTDGQGSTWRSIVRSKDPPTFSVLLDDTAALVGLAIAAAGTAVSTTFRFYAADGIASLAIGVLLAFVSFILARESKSLLIGEPATPRTIAAIRDIARRQPVFARLRDVWTSHLGPDQIAAILAVELVPDASAGDIGKAVETIEREVSTAVEENVAVFLKPIGGRVREKAGDGPLAEQALTSAEGPAT